MNNILNSEFDITIILFEQIFEIIQLHVLNSISLTTTKNKYNDPGSVPGFTKNKYFNVDAHLLDYTPRTIDELILRQK